jgi:aspartate/methionine/tyrosine aminotransferase
MAAGLGDVHAVEDRVHGAVAALALAAQTPAVPPRAGVVDGRWRLDLDSLARAVSSKTRAALLMSPSMPSGHVFTDDEWVAVAVACERADLLADPRRGDG